eukprot:m.12707 g.12707  ORF g.12707 m.12707 type:complete len:197 (+) comp10010_c0_seq1:274-864(+)
MGQVLPLSVMLVLLFLQRGDSVPCNELFPAMLCCLDNEHLYSPAFRCNPNGTVAIPCFPRVGVNCTGRAINSTNSSVSDEAQFRCAEQSYSQTDIARMETIRCNYVNADSAYDYETALALSVYFGMFGLDRFYLGYPAIGLLKLFTLGFVFVGQLVDIIFIALQVVEPADGSGYNMQYSGPKLRKLFADNDTYYVD